MVRFLLLLLIFFFSSCQKISTNKFKYTTLTKSENPGLENAYSLQEAFIKVAEKVKPAVVSITTVHFVEVPRYEFFFGDPFEDFFRDFFGEETPYFKKFKKKRSPRTYKYKQEGGGSGFIITEDGYILTNEHVVRDSDKITVILNIGEEEKKYEGKVVGKDEKSDIAVVKINPTKKLPAVPLGDSDKIKVGEWVVAIGSPFGLQQTVTSGIVSAHRQSVYVEGRTYSDFIQTDAAINRGNSGGPLVNLKGEVIGINTAIFAPTGVFSGVGFAIPINRAKEILDQLIHKGKVTRGWLGVEIRSIDDVIQKQFELPDREGALVNRVLEGSPADKAGLKRGDVIKKVDGEKIKDDRNLYEIISKTEPRKKVKLEIIRDSKPKTIEVTLGERPKESELMEGKIKKELKGEAEWLGIKVSDLNEDLAKEYEIPEDEKGVVIVDIEPEGKLAGIGLMEGDLIKSINRKKTPDVESFEKVVKTVKLSDGVVFDVLRQGRPLFISYSSVE